MKCPVCGAVYRPGKGNLQEREDNASPSLTCRRCKADLSDLLRLYNQAIWYHRHALDLFSQGNYSEATAYNNQALALHSTNADFHAFAGKLWALQGEFPQAIASWHQALQFDHQNAIAFHALEMIKGMREDRN